MNNNNNNNNEYTQMQMNVVRSPVCYIPQQFVVVCGGGWKRLLCDVCVCVQAGCRLHGNHVDRDVHGAAELCRCVWVKVQMMNAGRGLCGGADWACEQGEPRL